jgi:transcription antitermination factor NusB
MRKRTKAREFALQVLYQLDIRRGENDDLLLGDLWSQEEAVGGQIRSEIKEFAVLLVKGVMQHIKDIDIVISRYAENWELERMAVIDRNIIRMAAFELLYLQDIPPKVSINEAVDIAKKYNSIESGKFVNGILDKINKKERQKGEGEKS